MSTLVIAPVIFRELSELTDIICYLVDSIE